MKFVQNYKIFSVIKPVSLRSAPQGPVYSTLKHYPWVTYLFSFGAGAGTPAISFQQALNTNGNSAKTLGFTEGWVIPPSLTGDQDDQMGRFTVSGNSFNGAASTDYAIEFSANQLDVSNNFDCIRPLIASTTADLFVSVVAIFSRGRYIGEGNKAMGFAQGGGLGATTN